MNINKKSRASRRSSGGFTIIELLIVLAITAVAAIIAAQKLKASFLDQQAQQRAETISVLGRATANYIAKRRTTLPVGISDISLLQHLRTDGGLSSSFGSLVPTATPSSMGYIIRVFTDSNCSTNASCNVTAWVYSTTAWVIDGTVRLDLVGSAVNKIGLPGGMNSSTTSPLPGYTGGAIGKGGYPANWALTVAAAPAALDFPYLASGGQLFYNASVSPMDDASYVRINGTSTMTGNLQMANNNITGTGAVAGGSFTTTGQPVVAGRVSADNLFAAQTVAAGTSMSAGTSIVAGSTIAAGQSVTAGSNITAGTTITATGDITAGNAATGAVMKASGDVIANANIVGRSLSTTVAYNNAGGAPTAGTVAAETDVTIAALATRDSTPLTTSLKTLAPRLVEMATKTVDSDTTGASGGVVNGYSIPVPTCGTGGVPNIFVIPQKETGTTVDGLYGSVSRATGGPPGATWTLSVTDSQIPVGSPPGTLGAPIPSTNVPNYAAIVRTFCAY